MRRALTVGGPFCNLLGLLVARKEVEDFTETIDITRANLQDHSDVEANLFLRDIQDFFSNNRPVLSIVQGFAGVGISFHSGGDRGMSGPRASTDRLVL